MKGERCKKKPLPFATEVQKKLLHFFNVFNQTFFLAITLKKFLHQKILILSNYTYSVTTKQQLECNFN